MEKPGLFPTGMALVGRLVIWAPFIVVGWLIMLLIWKGIKLVAGIL